MSETCVAPPPAAPVAARRIALSSLTLVLESAIRLCVTAAVSFWIARSLGPAQFGLLNFASALTALSLGISTLGLEAPVTLRLAKGANPARLMGGTLGLRALAAGLAWLCATAVALALHYAEPLALAVTLIVALGVLGHVPTVFDYLFKARVQALPPAMARLTATLLAAAAKVACLISGGDLVALAWTVAFEGFATGALIALAWWHTTSGMRPRLRRPRSAQLCVLLRDSRPYLGWVAATMFAMKADVVLLGALSSPAQTGLYSVAQKLSEVLYVVPVALVDSAYPALARRLGFESSTAPLQGQLLFDMATAAALLSSLAGVALAQPLILALFGPAYGEAVALFHVHAFTCVAVAQQVALQRWLVALGLQRHAPAAAVIGALATVGLCAALVPPFGASGAVAAALVASLASAFALTLLRPELRPIGLMQLRALWPWQRLWAAWRSTRSAQASRT